MKIFINPIYNIDNKLDCKEQTNQSTKNKKEDKNSSFQSILNKERGKLK